MLYLQEGLFFQSPGTCNYAAQPSTIWGPLDLEFQAVAMTHHTLSLS